MMKNTFKITFCAIMAALGTVLMLLSYFPYFTYAVPAVAGVLTMVVLIEIGGKWPLITYIVTSVLVFLFAEPEAKFMYILLFGYYPILKAYIEKIKFLVLQYIIKLCVFNGAVLIMYGVVASLIGVSISEFGQWGYIGAITMLIFVNLTFLLYDIVLVRVADMYLYKLHPKIKKSFK